MCEESLIIKHAILYTLHTLINGRNRQTDNGKEKEKERGEHWVSNTERYRDRDHQIDRKRNYKEGERQYSDKEKIISITLEVKYDQYNINIMYVYWLCSKSENL